MRTIWRSLALCFSICFSGILPSQEYVFRNFRQAQGLSNLTVTALAFDSQGFLWVGTQNGLYRLVGSSFQRFGKEQGISEKHLRAVITTPDGMVWASTDKNFYRWTGTVFVPAASKPLFVKFPDSVAWEGPGRLLIEENNELERVYYLPDGEFSRFVPLFYNRLSAADPQLADSQLVKIAPDGSTWLACGKSLCHWEHNVLQMWGKQQGVPEEAHSGMVFGHDGSVWVVGDRHVLELPHDGRAFVDRTPFDYTHSFAYFQVAIAVDRVGRVLISDSHGLERWNGTDWQKFGADNGVQTDAIYPLLFNTEGDLLMGTFGSGLRQWVGYENWEGWTNRQGLPSSDVWSLDLHDGHSITVGTDTGPATIDLSTGKAKQDFTAKHWGYSSVTSILTEPNGDALYGTLFGEVLHRAAGSGVVQKVAQPGSFISKLFRDSAGRSFLLDYQHGIQEIKGTASSPQLIEIPGIKRLIPAKSPVYSACTMPGDVDWFSSRAGVLQRANNEWRKPPIDGFRQGEVPPMRGFTCAKDGTLWIFGKESGIWHLLPKNGRLAATELTLPYAVRSLSILDIFSDSRSWLWLATDDGLLVWNGLSWLHLNQEVGLIWNDVNQFNLSEGSDGSLWIGTSGGLAHLSHPERIFKQSSPRIALVEVRRGGASLHPSRALQIQWSRRDLSIQFAATGNFNREDLLYHYRIEGLQPTWTETKDATAHLQSLSPGSYSFEVYAQDQVSGVQSSVLRVQIEVKPPWWRTLWAYGGYALCGGLVIFLFFRLRMRHLLALKQRLEVLVSERTAELEASRQELYIQATHDSLSKLLNRSAILSAFENELQRAQREKLALIIALADIDHFKKVNDQHGHLAGDEAIRQFSSAIARSVRNYDFAGRYGGEEFMLVLTGVSTPSARERVAELHGAITNIRVTDNDTVFVITCSLGAICLEPSDNSDHRRMILASVDEALYEAKRSGRNRAVLRQHYNCRVEKKPLESTVPLLECNIAASL